jgi:hypothetical protein
VDAAGNALYFCVTIKVQFAEAVVFTFTFTVISSVDNDDSLP